METQTIGFSIRRFWVDNVSVLGTYLSIYIIAVDPVAGIGLVLFHLVSKIYSKTT